MNRRSIQYSVPSVNKNVDADISYNFIDEKGEPIPYTMVANTPFYLKNNSILKAYDGKVAVFWNKEDAIEFIKYWRELRLSKFDKMLNKYSEYER
jgi:hypothetical protein